MKISNNDISVDILVNGNEVATYHKDGNVFIESKHGSEFEIHIKNNTFGRVLAVSSVDGLNVLSGESANHDDGGYVIERFGSYKIKGFRYSDERVGAFKFTTRNESYAALKNDGSEKNCGVIGVMVYGESGLYTDNIYTSVPQPSFPDPSPYPYPYGTWCCDSTLKRGLGFDTGTTWGTDKISKVTETAFVRGHQLFNKDIYYASRASLIEMGVIAANTPKVSFPNSFTKYATPPTNWQG